MGEKTLRRGSSPLSGGLALTEEGEGGGGGGRRRDLIRTRSLPHSTREGERGNGRLAKREEGRRFGFGRTAEEEEEEKARKQEGNGVFLPSIPSIVQFLFRGPSGSFGMWQCHVVALFELFSFHLCTGLTTKVALLFKRNIEECATRELCGVRRRDPLENSECCPVKKIGTIAKRRHGEGKREGPSLPHFFLNC